jgi:hypothetical protein
MVLKLKMVLKRKHILNLIDPSPWPFAAALSAFILTSGGILYMHKFHFGFKLLKMGFYLMLFITFTWWRDIIREANFEDSHTFGESNQAEVKLIAKINVNRLKNTINPTQNIINLPINNFRQNHVMSKTSLCVRGFRTRSSVIGQDKLKVCFAPKGARFFSNNQITDGPNNHKTIKNIIFDMFLKYQFTICVEPKIPISHIIPLSILTCVFDSTYYLTLYWISILYILSTFVYNIAEKFPDSFGYRYLNFFKRYSSTEAFEKYCGNPLAASSKSGH